MKIARKDEVYSVELDAGETIEVTVNSVVVYTATIMNNKRGVADFRLNQNDLGPQKAKQKTDKNLNETSEKESN